MACTWGLGIRFSVVTSRLFFCIFAHMCCGESIAEGLTCLTALRQGHSLLRARLQENTPRMFLHYAHMHFLQMQGIGMARVKSAASLQGGTWVPPSRPQARRADFRNGGKNKHYQKKKERRGGEEMDGAYASLPTIACVAWVLGAFVSPPLASCLRRRNRRNTKEKQEKHAGEREEHCMGCVGACVLIALLVSW